MKQGDTKFGGQLRQADWVQKTVCRDPFPQIPFADQLPDNQKIDSWQIIIYVALFGVVVLLAALEL